MYVMLQSLHLDIRSLISCSVTELYAAVILLNLWTGAIWICTDSNGKAHLLNQVLNSCLLHPDPEL